MLIRTLALALLIGATQAQAAPKKHKPAAPPAQKTATTPDVIDVDAMARAKDVNANTGGPADAPAQNAATDDPAAPAPADLAKEKASSAPAQAEPAPATNDTAKPDAS
ncbi:MAG: hypothetical protein ABIQ70_00075, partial [Dokdonella sp.]